MRRKLMLKLKLQKAAVAKWLLRQQMDGYGSIFVWPMTKEQVPEQTWLSLSSAAWFTSSVK